MENNNEIKYDYKGYIIIQNDADYDIVDGRDRVVASVDTIKEAEELIEEFINNGYPDYIENKATHNTVDLYEEFTRYCSASKTFCINENGLLQCSSRNVLNKFIDAFIKKRNDVTKIDYKSQYIRQDDTYVYVVVKVE